MRVLLLALGCALGASSLAAQEWDTGAARQLAARAVARRALARQDAAHQRYRSRAEGMVFFLARVGAAEEPRLLQADQLTVEVYWQAPNRSKQNIVAWRSRQFVPTGLHYHRDHLGIVTGDFGDDIRLGLGDEVRDVPHPLSPAGLRLYQYALGDSVTLRTPDGALTVQALAVRPRDPDSPAVAGTLYLDLREADLVRFRFGFTRAAYLQPDLESITVVLENALFEQRAWRPWRQELEIRRRTAWLDVPFHTAIVGRWRIDDHDLDPVLPPAAFAGGEYGGLPNPGPDTGWAEPLGRAVERELGQVVRADPESVRREVLALVGAAARAPPVPRLALGSLSDLVRVNRVQGFAMGLGGSAGVPGTALTISAGAMYGTADRRLLGRAALEWDAGRATLGVGAARTLADLGPWPAASGLLNSVLAQGGGRDYGDWALVERVEASLAHPLGARTRLEVRGGWERSRSVAVAATPFSGRFRPNPPLGGGDVGLLELGLRASGAASGEIRLLAGAGDRDFVRLVAAASGQGPARLAWELRGGTAFGDPPPYLGFALGGRGSLVGEPFRAFAGRRAVLGRAEWRLPVRPAGAGGRGGLAAAIQGATGVVLAPFVALGWVDGALEGLEGRSRGGVRPVLGVAGELLFQVVRIEAGWAPRAGRVGVVLDVTRAWWPML